MQASTSTTIQTPSPQISQKTPSHHAMALSSYKIPLPISIPNHNNIYHNLPQMASFNLSLLLFVSSVALFLVADASILRTTVSQVEDTGSCSTMTLTPCMNWVRYSTTADEDWDPSTGSQQYKEECCGMMKGMDMDCMCSSLKHTFREECMSGQGQGQGQSSKGHGGMCRQITQKLMNVPKMCGFTDQMCPHTTLLV